MGVWKSVVAGLIAGGALVAGPALAQQSTPGWYAGGSLGQSTAQDACDGLGGGGISCDDEDSAWKIFGGYQVNRNFAIELGYTDLGEVSASGAGVRASIEATAWELVGVGSLPVADRFSLYGKLGFYRAEAEGRSNVGLSADESNTGLTFAVGASYDISRSVSARLEWQKYANVGGDDVGESDVDVLSVGILVRF